MRDNRRLIPLTEVKPESLHWLWPHRVPLGAITILEGDPGQGKSALTYDMAARVTTGRAMPNCIGATTPAGVVLLQAEDSLSSTVRSSLQAAGADLTRVQVYDKRCFVDEPLLLPRDLDILEVAAGDVQARLVVIDPLTAFLDGLANADQSIRRALSSLMGFAARARLAVVLVRHLCKNGRANPLYRGAGSIGIIAAARSGLLVSPDPSVEGAEYESFFSSHQLEHKLTEKSKSATFDALGCDGAGNYIKATRAECGGCQVEAFKARSYGRTSKETLQGWLMDVYRTDNLTELPPLAEDQELLSLPRACREARAALEAGAEQVYLPLGLHKTKVMNYHIIKASAFLFQTHRQRRAILKRIQDFEEEFGCGLEVLAFRRTYGERRKGSVVAVLNAIDAVIQAGESNLVTALNLKKVTDLVETVAPKRKEELEKRKAHARQDLWERIDASRLAREADPTAWLVTQDDLLKVREDGTLLPMQAAPSIVHSPAGMMPVR